VCPARLARRWFVGGRRGVPPHRAAREVAALPGGESAAPPGGEECRPTGRREVSARPAATGAAPPLAPTHAVADDGRHDPRCPLPDRPQAQQPRVTARLVRERRHRRQEEAGNDKSRDRS
jgi:hypothetical protein